MPHPPPAPDPPGVTHNWVTTSGVRLHYVEAAPAAGPPAPGRLPVVLLHGFPEFWYGWRFQLPALAAAGFRAVAPDLRGYNLSDKPKGVRAYRIDRLVEDVAGLIGHLGGRVHLVGHDWGGVIAWYAAMHAPALIDRLVILNAPHPAAYLREVRRPGQLLRSWYAFAFQLPRLPEAGIRAKDFRSLRRLFRLDPADKRAFTAGDIERYVEAFSRPGALTAAVNYYRAAFRTGPSRLSGEVRRIERPTLLIWGERDRYLVPQLTQGLEQWVTDLRVERLPQATHWVQHDEPDAVNRLLLEFFGGGGG